MDRCSSNTRVTLGVFPIFCSTSVCIKTLIYLQASLKYKAAFLRYTMKNIDGFIRDLQHCLLYCLSLHGRHGPRGPLAEPEEASG